MIGIVEMIKPAVRKGALSTFTNEELEQAEIQLKYDTYIEKEKNWYQK